MSLTDQLKKLRIGRTMRVKTESDRQALLRDAKTLAILIHTRPSKRGGFTVTRIPE